MNCIIVDDDILTCKILEEYVRKTTCLNLAGIFNDPIVARDLLSRRHDIDIAILDVRMPYLDGFEFIQSLDSRPNIIIVTSSEEFALKAFDFNVADYLLKPVTYGRFCKAIDKVIMYYSCKEASAGNTQEIFIRDGTSLVKLKLNDIIFIEALENYICVNTADKKFTIHFTMKAFEGQLSSNLFVRVHRSFIINKMNIKAIYENSVDISTGKSLKNIPVGKSYKSSLLRLINVMTK